MDNTMFPGIGRGIPDSYSSSSTGSTDSEDSRKMFRNAETVSTGDSDGRIAVVPISDCSVRGQANIEEDIEIVNALVQVDIRGNQVNIPTHDSQRIQARNEHDRDSAAAQQAQEARENLHVSAHPASSNESSFQNLQALDGIREADTENEEEFEGGREGQRLEIANQRWQRGDRGIRLMRAVSSSSSGQSSSSGESGYRSRSPLRGRRPGSIDDEGESLSPPSTESDRSGEDEDEQMDSI